MERHTSVVVSCVGNRYCRRTTPCVLARQIAKRIGARWCGDKDATTPPLTGRDTHNVATYLDVPSLKMYLRIGQTDTLDDALLEQVVDAVEAEQRARLRSDAFNDPEVTPYDVPPTTTGGPTSSVPSDVYHAALMRGARLYARRASPEGLVGLGELGVARIPAYDRDIDALEAPWRNVVLA